MLSEAIGNLLPSALAVALSPIPVIAVILMLGTSRARANGPAFAVGWVLGLVTVSAVVLVAASGTDDPDSGASTTSSAVQAAFGVLLLWVALKQWRGRPASGEEAEMPSWMADLDHFTPVRSLGLGVLLSAVNPKNLALTLTAAASIAQAGLDTTDSVIAVAVFVVIGSATTVGAVIAYLVGGDRVTATLASIRQFMATHNAVIMMIVCLVLGAKLLGDSVPALLD
jgi:threonine/homoserine/homoserine lactone efflux protein